MKVRFEDKVLDPSTGEVSRVDTATLLFPISALANDPDAPAPASAPEVPAPAAEAPAPEPAAPAPAPMLFDDSQLEAESAEPAVLGGTAGLGPAFTRGEIEPPAGEKTVGGATIGVYTAEQQLRLGVDEEGKKVDDAAAAAAAVVAPVAAAEPPVLGGTAGLGPAFTRGEIEPPAGEKTVGGATIGVYTAEQQSRLGVDEEGKKVDDAAAIGPSEAPSLDQDIDRI